MSRAINEEAPLEGIVSRLAGPKRELLPAGYGIASSPTGAGVCQAACGVCSICSAYNSHLRVLAENHPIDAINSRNAAYGRHPEAIAHSLQIRAEHYQVALREEGEAMELVRKAAQALAEAEEALNDASVQLTLTRNGLFKACGL